MTNASGWDPPPGMVKKQCRDCGRLFACEPSYKSKCPTCQVPSIRRRYEDGAVLPGSVDMPHGHRTVRT